MTLAMDGVHNAVRRVVDGLPRGSLLDVGAGYGGFSEWACDKGFEVTAMDVNPDAFQNEQIRCHAADLNGRWPVEDASYDVVVSIEVMEHLENHYSFLRECCRVCKPNGRIIISTPNCHSIESRWNYMLTGFDDCSPRPIDHEDPKMGSIYMEHVHPMPLPIMELGLRACGFEIEDVSFSRRRKSATVLLPFWYPLMWWRTYRQLVLREHKPHVRKRNRKLMKLFMKPGLLTGRVTVFKCRKAA